MVTVEPPDPNRGERYFSIKFVCEDTEIYFVFQKRDLYVVTVIAKVCCMSYQGGISADFDDVKFGKLLLGSQYDYFQA